LLSKLKYYIHTLRYLRWIQIQERIRKRFSSPKIDLSQAPAMRTITGYWQDSANRRQCMVGINTFQFLNVERTIKSGLDWNNADWEKLWLYNLHYFDDLTAYDSEQRTDWHWMFIQQWIDKNPEGQGNGWEPYPSSLRIVNWIKWSLAGNTLEDDWLHSLAIQVRYLSNNLETHLLGNHLFANAKALCFAGLFFDGKEGDDWYKIGLRLIEREVVEQLCDDGGNFELSTMYHIIFLEDLLDLMNIHSVFNRELPVGVENSIIPMLNWLHVMCHPDGEISFFNDASLGVAPSVAEITDYAGRLGFVTKPVEESLIDLESSGYSRVVKGEAVALIDRAAVGPDYLPGHAHADSLSFELSLFGKRVVVNSGTSVYGEVEQRQIERGTASHSTLLIDNQNSSEVWGGFRVARRAYVNERFQQKEGQSIRLVGCHSGYMRLRGKPKHCREWLFEDNSILISDRITGNWKHQAVAVLPLHPEVVLQDAQLNQCDLIVEGHKVKIEFEGDGELEVVESAYHPEFGLSIANQHLHFKVKMDLPIELKTRISW
jgi:uncharacterized heparinase superfamily protein